MRVKIGYISVGMMLLTMFLWFSPFFRVFPTIGSQDSLIITLVLFSTLILAIIGKGIGRIITLSVFGIILIVFIMFIIGFSGS